MQPIVQAFFDSVTGTITYVVFGPGERCCAVIDPVLDYDPKAGRTSTTNADKVIEFVRQRGLQVQWILETHAHADHLSAAHYLRIQLGGKIAIGEHIRTVQRTFKKLFNLGADFRLDGSQFDRLFAADEAFSIGSLTAKALYVPGHTAADTAYQIGDAVFVGDTLFMPDLGTARCDFPGGDAHTLYRSIRKLFSLPGTTRLFMCHDYPPEGRDAEWETTVSAQRAHNIHVHDGVTEEQFVRVREARDATLAMPVLLLPSVQINIRAGEFPPVEENGISYLKIPLNAL
ncbi:MAG: MBL fold metallo-hydrolase [Trinickia sp.]|uniref:MBL fold metallo-hydrolase n=1 Tax=Trinickia sp. TaxID=2571163 RepID=UPI003F7EBEB3